MKTLALPFLFFLLTTLHLNAQNILIPPQQEIGKKGLYQVESLSFPEKYHNIWTKTPYGKHQSKIIKYDKKKSYKTSPKLPFKWTVYTPPTYSDTSTPGILVITSRIKINNFPQNWTNLAQNQNLILIAPDFGGGKLMYFSAEAILASLDIIKSRYKINEHRIYYGSTTSFKFQVHIHSPDLFKGFFTLEQNSILWSESHLKSSLGGKKYRTLEASLKKARYMFIAANNVTAYAPNSVTVNFDSSWNLKWEGLIFSTQNGPVRVTQGAQPEETVFSQVDLSCLTKAITYLDSDLKDKGIELFAAAQKSEAQGEIKQALDLYMQAYKNLSAQAMKNYLKLINNLKHDEQMATSHFNDGKYPEAYQLALKNIKSFGPQHASISLKIKNDCEKDKKISQEIKAANYLLKVQKALKAGKSKPEVIRKALNDVIAFCPGTQTAENAQRILEGLK